MRDILVLGGLLSFVQLCHVSLLNLRQVLGINFSRLHHLQYAVSDVTSSGQTRLSGVNEPLLSFLKFLQLLNLVLDDRQQIVELALHSICLVFKLIEEECLELFAIDLTLVLCHADLGRDQCVVGLASLIDRLLHEGCQLDDLSWSL